MTFRLNGRTLRTLSTKQFKLITMRNNKPIGLVQREYRLNLESNANQTSLGLSRTIKSFSSMWWIRCCSLYIHQSHLDDVSTQSHRTCRLHVLSILPYLRPWFIPHPDGCIGPHVDDILLCHSPAPRLLPRSSPSVVVQNSRANWTTVTINCRVI